MLPSEAWMLAQTITIGAFASWGFGGATPVTRDWIFVLAVLPLPLLLLRGQEVREWRFLPLVPAAAWLAFTVIALVNRSHTPAPNGGWVERSDWIRWLPTTADRENTLHAMRLWLAALLQGGCLVALLHTARAVRLIWSVLALNGCLLAVTGACFQLAGVQRMLGHFDTPEATYFFATFFYKNHWAAFGALAATSSFALSLHHLRASLNGHPPARGKGLLFAATGLLTAVTLPFPGSRAGAAFAAVLIAAFFLTALACLWRARAFRRHGQRWLALIAGTVAIGILAVGFQVYAPKAKADLERTRAQLSRSLDGEALDLRVVVSRDTWRMALARPWFGWGSGCFEIVFPVFQGKYLRHPDGRPAARFEFAHNDWLQICAELGFLGAPLLVLPAMLVAWKAWRRARLPGRFALAGCGLIALHGWIDFPFHNPAVLLLWVTLLTTAHRIGAGEAEEESGRAFSEET